ncbi:T9SS type A sorting domain-containing protein [Aureivirga sp. CE67]|uniref:T9SS type A sorting domain-containing protein n=1 Tax=Aureivirga sp. CE67 TaxID=1788983 RepID=UPI0018CA67A3|nr:T9SS type A sorting domain-containing protein [Aureivirga sp. CE67]
MKKILLFICLISFIKTNAQGEEILGTTWIAEKIIINGEEFIAPAESESNGIANIYFLESNSENNFEIGIFTGLMNMHAIVEYNFSENQFTILDFYNLLKMQLRNTNIYPFEDEYTGFFKENNEEYNPYIYEEIEENGITYLHITNNKGDKAIYTSENLSVVELEKKNFSMYPNPVVGEKVTLDYSGNLDLSSVKLLDLNGKLLNEKVIFNSKEITFFLPENIKEGVYFISVMDSKNRRVFVERVLVE